MKALTFLLLIIISLSNVSMAKGIDRVFEGNRKQSFGRAVDNLFNLSHYDKSYALVVGISQYTGDFKSITSARNDANRMKDFLINEAGFDHVHMLTEEKVTQNRLYNIIAQFSRKIGKRDRFVFYWSGHGESYSFNDRKIGFLPFSNAGTSDIGNMLMMSTLREWDTLIKANQALYIVDACFSGLANAIDVKSAKRNLTLNQLAQPSRQILTAGQDDETTIASNHYKGSLFTTAVIDELRGTFDATGRYHHDGIVSANELILAVRSRINHEVLTNPSLRGFKLTPTLKEMVPSKGDFFFLSNKQKVDKAIGYATPSQKNTVEIKSQQSSQPTRPKHISEKERKKADIQWGIQITEHIKRYWFPPPGSAGQSALVKVGVTANGYVKEFQLVECKAQDFCESIKAAFEKAEPLPRPSHYNLSRNFIITMD